MTPLVRKISSMLNIDRKFVWFDAGVENWTNEKWNLEILSKIPFESIAIVCKAETAKMDVLVIAIQKCDFITLMGYGLGDDKHTKAPIIAYTVRDDKISFFDENKNPIFRLEDADDSRRSMEILQKLLLSLDAGGTCYKMTPRNSPTNKRRAAKGKGPISVDWHTVTIAPRVEKTRDACGTHASPRKHQRRGHWRNHPNGNRVWVRDCWVGDAAKGMVFKDYKVEQKGDL